MIAGVGYALAYQIIQFFAEGTGVERTMIVLGWLLALPVPAFLLWWLPRQISRDDDEREPEASPEAGAADNVAGEVDERNQEAD